MPEYTIKDVEIKKELPSFAKGPAHVLLLTLQSNGNTEQAEMFAMKSTPMPEVGSKVEGTIEQSDYGPKFKKAGGRGGGGYKGKSPAEEMRIVRQHSAEMALRACAILGHLPDEESFRNLVQWFVDDAYGKMKSGTNAWPMNSDVPADLSGTPFE